MMKTETGDITNMDMNSDNIVIGRPYVKTTGAVEIDVEDLNTEVLNFETEAISSVWIGTVTKSGQVSLGRRVIGKRVTIIVHEDWDTRNIYDYAEKVIYEGM